MPPTKVKLAVGEQITLHVTKADRYTAANRPYVGLSDGTTEFSASAAAVTRQLARYGFVVPDTDGPVPGVPGNTWRITRKAAPGYDNGLLDYDMVDGNGRDISPAEYKASALATVPSQRTPMADPEDEDWLDGEPVETGGPPTPARARPAPAAPVAAKAAPEAVAAIKAGLRPDQDAERHKIAAKYEVAMTHAAQMHLRVAKANGGYEFDGSAVQATAFTLHKMWQDAGVSA